MKKRILFVVNSLGVGGAEKSLTSLLNMMDYDRYEVDLLMFNPGGMFLKLLPEQVRVLPQLDFLKSNQSIRRQLLHPVYLAARVAATIGLRLNSKNKLLHPAQCYWKYAGRSFNALPDEYDAAIAWGQGNPTHYVARKVHAKVKIAFINADYEGVGHNKDFDKSYYAEYNHIAAVSDKLEQMLRNTFPEYANKIATVYDINNAEMIGKMAMESNPFENDTVHPVIVTVGRLVQPKGYDLAVEAARNLKLQGINFRWYIVGEGPSRNQIEQAIRQYDLSEYVVLVGAKDNPYVYMKNADLYVQTSRFEGYCLTLAEARMLNKPVISTNFDVVYNQLRDGENGLIVQMDPEEIASAIVRLWKDVSLQNHIVENLKREKKGNPEEIEKLYRMIEE